MATVSDGAYRARREERAVMRPGSTPLWRGCEGPWGRGVAAASYTPDFAPRVPWWKYRQAAARRATDAQVLEDAERPLRLDIGSCGYAAPPAEQSMRSTCGPWIVTRTPR
jgi:hypothetical protein